MTDFQQSQDDHGTDDATAGDRPVQEDLAERRPGGSDDLGGPASTLGGGVENALTGEQADEKDEGSASSSPEPR
jgi:hypothetical protein